MLARYHFGHICGAGGYADGLVTMLPHELLDFLILSIKTPSLNGCAVLTSYILSDSPCSYPQLVTFIQVEPSTSLSD